MRYTEVEMKYRLDDPDLLIAALRQRNCTPGEPKHQVDSYFNAPHRDFLAPPIVAEWLRIREETGNASINYKLWLPLDAEIKTHCDEYETPVQDPEAVRRTLRALDFTELTTVDKIRQEWRIGDEFIVALDTVSGLGSFVELEYAGDAGSVAEAIARLDQLVADLGVPLGEPIHRGYPHMLLGRDR